MLEARFLDPCASETQAAWADLWARSPQRTPFGTLAYARAICEAAGLRLGMASVFDGDRLAAGVLLFERRRGPIRLAVVPPFTPCTSPLLAAMPAEADVLARRTPLDVLLPALERRYDALAFHLHPSLDDVRTFTWSGYACSPLYTYRLALEHGTDPLRDASRKVRRQLGGSEGWEIRSRSTQAAASEVVRLVEGSFARQRHRLPLPLDRIEHFVRSLGEEAILLLAREHPGAAPSGALLALSDGETAYELLAGSVPGPARTRLTHEMARSLRDSGHETYDFAGANTPSIAEFKRSFGGRLVPYFRAVRYTSAWARWIGHTRPLV